MKCTITSYNRTIIFHPQTTTSKTGGTGRDQFKCKCKGQNSGPSIGTYIPSNVPASKSYWKAQLLEVLEMSHELVKPSFFMMLIVNDDWPKSGSCISDAPNNPLAQDRTDSPVDYIVVSIIAYMCC